MLTPRLQLLSSTVTRLVRRGAKASLTKIMRKYRPEELAVAFLHLTLAERMQLFQACPDDEYQTDLLSELEVDIAAELILGMPPQGAAKFLQHMDPDDAADIIGELPEERQTELLQLMQSGGQEHLEELLRYDESTAGGIMNPNVFALPRGMKVHEAIEALQDAEDAEIVFYVYVVNDQEQLVGVVPLRRLVTSKPNVALDGIMTADVISVQPEEDQEEVAKLVSRYGFLSIPVVDQSRRLLGIVTVDDVIDVIREEATEDILKMAGAGHALMESHSVWTSVRVRLPWLLATAVTGSVNALVISHFQASLSQVLALAFFIPVVLGMGGNVGTQSASIVVRGLAMGRISLGQFWTVLKREMSVGFILGFIYGAMVGGFGILKLSSTGWHNALLVGGTVGTSIAASMTLGSMVAAMYPMLFERLNVDPAAASGPFVTTTTDLLGTLTYFLVAKHMLGL
ncbi:MAG: magnesium transporter [Deltaproteobacteria bacterium]|nr:magnesium transporter [Deltaproteobacteria bacterium]